MEDMKTKTSPLQGKQEEMKQKFKEKIWWPLLEFLLCRKAHTWIKVPNDVSYPDEPYYCRWCREWKGKYEK